MEDISPVIKHLIDDQFTDKGVYKFFFWNLFVYVVFFWLPFIVDIFYLYDRTGEDDTNLHFRRWWLRLEMLVVQCT